VTERKNEIMIAKRISNGISEIELKKTPAIIGSNILMY
jgi:hypothetical protein